MKFTLTKKDIFALNQKIKEHTCFRNEQSLDFALSYARRTENWIKALAYAVRAINLDHVFEDGNKRTTALLIKSYIEYEGYEAYKDKVVKLVADIATNRIKSIKRIEEKIKNVIK
ncbi:hypothetical protein GF323_05335 [Candidatus Woesearchaeota archaeon]|nr:hypothetical protein [Candidatus Woesearchaeota archaeon]